MTPSRPPSRSKWLLIAIAAVLATGIALRVAEHQAGLGLTVAVGVGCFVGYLGILTRLTAAWSRIKR